MAPPVPAQPHSAVLTALLLCGLAVLLVLTLTARDLQQPPGFMVGSGWVSGFGTEGQDASVTLRFNELVEMPLE